MEKIDSKKIEGTLNKDTGEMILWEKKGLGSYNPAGEDEYVEQLIDFVDRALYPLAGLCQMLNRIGDESEDSGLSSVIESLMHNTRNNINILADFLEMTLGKISLKIQGQKFVYTGGPVGPPRAIVFKPAEHLGGYLELAKVERKKVTAVSGPEGD